jgi:hypothetical protein
MGWGCDKGFSCWGTRLGYRDAIPAISPVGMCLSHGFMVGDKFDGMEVQRWGKGFLASGDFEEAG